MPKLKSVIAGLAISTAMAGGVVGLGAATTATSASAAQISTGTSVLTGGGCHRRRCGWGGGGWGGHRRHHNRIHIHIFNHNLNNNINENRRHERRFDRFDRRHRDDFDFGDRERDW
ncbi:hypothetical protein SAMN05421869_10746 [Nonomuraea jiangxiensis]|uniref:Uncharacterized protein n=2 Tax=Nonomuraea jiangxiensis TaxID=633440 RepID=A0A1G8N7Z8_9ACTN|nr:hypothetical protein SAMN05421869_10746 [Nonomuraea jiangxiensis]